MLDNKNRQDLLLDIDRVTPARPDEILVEVERQNNLLFAMHSERVASSALKLAEKIKETRGGMTFDREALIHGSLLHDIKFYEDFENHAEKGAQYFKENLFHLYNEETGEKIRNAIMAHSMNSAEEKNSIEAEVINDADKIDCINTFITKMLDKAYARTDKPEDIFETCRYQIQRLFDATITEEGKETFITTLNEKREIFPWLTNHPILFKERYVFV